MARRVFEHDVTSELISNYQFLGPYNSELSVSYFRGLMLAPNLYGSWFPIPCRKCRACRKLKSLDWSSRCVVEMKSHAVNSFVTLTYNNSNLPSNGSLNHDHFVEFMKRYRRYLDRKNYGSKIRFYMCGEYGPKLQRPHYHAIVFGHMFDDLIRVPEKEHDHEVFYSPDLERLWRKGYVTVGQASAASARYVASYIHKKITGPIAINHYGGRKPEYNKGSTRKAIGLAWLEQYWTDVFNFDEFVLDGRSVPIPEFFNRKFKEWFPDRAERLSISRKLKGFDRLDAMYDRGESDLANRTRDGKFLEIIHSNSFRRSYESV